MIGDYGLIGDKGGDSDAPMEAFTGFAATKDPIEAKDDAVLADFARFQRSGEAVTCGTIDRQSKSDIVGFNGAGQGPYALGVTNNGEQADLMQYTVCVTDASKQVADVTDDGTSLVGTDLDTRNSSVVYSPGKLNVQFVAGKSPKSAADLRLSASVRGLVDKDIRLHAWHAYMFDHYDEKTQLIYFKNPWGTDHPLRGITAKEFRAYFTSVYHGQVRAKPDVISGAG